MKTSRLSYLGLGMFTAVLGTAAAGGDRSPTLADLQREHEQASKVLLQRLERAKTGAERSAAQAERWKEFKETARRACAGRREPHRSGSDRRDRLDDPRAGQRVLRRVPRRAEPCLQPFGGEGPFQRKGRTHLLLRRRRRLFLPGGEELPRTGDCEEPHQAGPWHSMPGARYRRSEDRAARAKIARPHRW